MHGEPELMEMDDRPLDPFTRKWFYVSAGCGLLCYFLLVVTLGDWGRGRAASICCFVGMTATRACWHLRRHAWFWIVLVIMVALHVTLVLAFPWPRRSYPGYTLLPEAALDYGIFYGSFKAVEKLTRWRTRSGDQ